MVNCSFTRTESYPTSLGIEDFKSAVLDMDAMSQSGFSKISTIARLVLAALQTPVDVRRQEDVANALSVIREIADDMENCINCRAEEVGANYIDDPLRSGLAAARCMTEIRGDA